MSNTYTWAVNSLNCLPSEDGQTNIVSMVHWAVNGTNGTYTASIYGTQPLSYISGTPFISYDELTQDIVIGWTKDAMGVEQVASIEQNLDNQIANLANPPIVTPPLPWGIA